MREDLWLEINNATSRTPNMAHEKLLRYIKQGYIQSDGLKFNLTRTNFLIEYERYLSTNYIRLSTLFKKHIKTTHHRFSTFMEAYKYLFTFIKFNKSMYVINHDNKQYIKHEAVNEILEQIISKSEAINKTKSNDILFNQFIQTYDIEILTFSSTSEYITHQTFKQYEKHLKKNNLDNTTKWEKVYSLFMSGNYNSLSIFIQGLKDICVKFGVQMMIHEGKYYADVEGLNFINDFIKKNDEYMILKNDNFFIDSTDDFHLLSQINLERLIRELNDYYIRHIEFNYEGFNKVLLINKQDYKRFIKKRNVALTKVQRIEASGGIVTNDFKSQIIKYIKRVIDQDINSDLNGTTHNLRVKSQTISVQKLKKSKSLFKDRKKQFQIYSRGLYDKRIVFNNQEKYYVTMINSEKCEIMLDLKKTQLAKLRTENMIPSVKNGAVYLYNIKSIRIVLQRYHHIRKNYYPIDKVQHLKFKNFLRNKKDLYEVNGCEVYAFGGNHKKLILKRVYEIEKRKFIASNQHDSIDYSNPYKSYVEFVEIYSIADRLPKETLNYWYDFVRIKLEKTQQNNRGIEQLISVLVGSLKILVALCKEEDVYNKNATYINFYMKSSRESLDKKRHILNFLKYVYNSRFFKNEKLNYQFSKLDFTIVKNNSTIDKRNTRKDYVYDDEVFLDLLSYTKKSFHKEYAISDALNNIKKYKHRQNKDYCYSWFYILLHLNNAWRHTDFINMNMIDISFLDIKSLEELRETKLKKEEIDRVISYLINRKYVVSKTGATNNLFISEELKQSVVTAYLVCHFQNEKRYPLSKKIINFSNRRNVFGAKQHSILKEFKHDIKITNRRMNKTLLTTMTKMISKYDDSSQIYYVSQALRGHENYKSSNYYVKYTDQEIHKVTKNLFDIGVFGFIPNLLEQIVHENSLELSIEEHQANEVIRNIKNIYNIEVSAGFINRINEEKISIIDYINDYGVEKAYSILSKLSLNMMGGKDENYQCLRSNLGCNRPGLDCKNCLMSIPNRYTLVNIVKSINQRIKDITDNFSNYTEIEKVRVANAMFSELNLFHDAINTFGEVQVMDMLEAGHESYTNILDQLDYLNSSNNLLDYVSKSNLLESD